MPHFMTYEFIGEFMNMKTIVKSYMDSGGTKILMAPSQARRPGACARGRKGPWQAGAS